MSGLYDSLASVLREALEQASAGKGKERHAGEGEAFEDQQIVQFGEWLGSNHFQLGQACKKIIESARLPPDRARAELLGAINYIAAAVIQTDRANRAPAPFSSAASFARAAERVLREDDTPPGSVRAGQCPSFKDSGATLCTYIVGHDGACSFYVAGFPPIEQCVLGTARTDSDIGRCTRNEGHPGECYRNATGVWPDGKRRK